LTLFSHLFKDLAVSTQSRPFTSDLLKTGYDLIAISRVELDHPGRATGSLRGNESSAGSCKRIEHDLAAS
jgi:hypothetical protein